MPHDGIQPFGIALDGNAPLQLLAGVGFTGDGVAVGHACDGAADLQLVGGLLGVTEVLQVGSVSI